MVTTVSTIATRSAMASIAAPAAGQVVYLTEAGREGIFECFSGSVPQPDSLQGLYVASTASGFYWSRAWDQVHGRPEWFGAVQNNASIDCHDAIVACYKLCPITQLSQADYFVLSTLNLNTSYRTFMGVGNQAQSQGQGSRIILQAASSVIHTADIMVVGSVNQPTPTSSGSTIFPTENHFSNFTLIRDGAPTPATSGDITQYPAGLRIKYVVRSTFKEITSRESSVGFYVGGSVYTKIDDCLSERSQNGTTSTNDYYAGYYLDGGVAFGRGDGSSYAGGNASIYMNRCAAVGQNSGAVTPYGLRARGAFVDTFVTDFECAGIVNGMEIAANGANSTGQTIDMHVIGAKLDGCSGFGLEVNLSTTSSASIEIIDPYILAPSGSSGDRGILIYNGAGLVTITGGQIHYNFSNGSIWLSQTRGVTVQGTKIHEASKPVVAAACNGLQLSPQINNVSASTTSFAIIGTSITRSLIKPVVIGASDKLQGGVSLDGASQFTTVDGSSIDPGCFHTVAAGNKVWYNGSDARGNTSFTSAGNVLSGVTG